MIQLVVIQLVFTKHFFLRLLKELKKKDDQQIELEKKEQGFSIYVNGANVEFGNAHFRTKSRSTSRHSKTAGGTNVQFFDGLKISVVKQIDKSQTVVTTENELIFFFF